MRLPWQQLTMDGKRRAKSFGLLLGIGTHAGVGFASDLWEAALDLAPDGDFTGAFDDPGVLVAHAGGNPRGCTAEPARVVELLQRVGLVETTPELRVRGLDRYEPAWRKNRRNMRKSMKSRTITKEPARNPRGTRAEPAVDPTPKTETETETETKTSSVAPAKKLRDPREPKMPAPVDPRFAPLIGRLKASYLELIGVAYDFSDADGGAVKRLLTMAADDEVDLRWRRGLGADRFSPKCATVLQLAQRWNELAIERNERTGQPSAQRREEPATRPEGRIRL